MTDLERLIKAHTRGTTITTLSAATERVCEELARETVKSPEFRAELQALVREFFGTTMRQLQRNGNRRRARARRSR